VTDEQIDLLIDIEDDPARKETYRRERAAARATSMPLPSTVTSRSTVFATPSHQSRTQPPTA